MKRILLMLVVTIKAIAGSVGEDERAFAFNLYDQLDKKENIVFSPFSVFSNLALLSFGAEGTTADQLKQALHINVSDKKFLDAFYTFRTGLTRKAEKGYQFMMANGLFVDDHTQFRAAFKEIGTRAFGARLQAVDFANPDTSLNSINKWVSKKTNGFITSLLDPQDVSSATRLVLANAVYFQGDWVYPFSKKTSKAPFYLEKSSPVIVKMMRQVNVLPYFNHDDAQGIKLPFVRKGVQQPALDCVIVVPHRDIESIDLSTFNRWLESATPTNIEAHIPKFCLKQKLNLSEPLQALGIKDAFSQAANFENIDGSQNLILTSVLHETFFNFTKTGVTAAAATSSQIGIKSPAPSKEEPVLFLANRPFLFFIVESHTNAILFMGHINNPGDISCGH